MSDLFGGELTWTCHICQQERPDAAISVWKHERSVAGLSLTEHVRYCNDRAECAEAAKSFHFVPLTEGEVEHG